MTQAAMPIDAAVSKNEETQAALSMDSSFPNTEEPKSMDVTFNNAEEAHAATSMGEAIEGCRIPTGPGFYMFYGQPFPQCRGDMGCYLIAS